MANKLSLAKVKGIWYIYNKKTNGKNFVKESILPFTKSCQRKYINLEYGFPDLSSDS